MLSVMYSIRRPKYLQRASSDEIEVRGVVDVPGSRMLALPYNGKPNHVRSRGKPTTTPAFFCHSSCRASPCYPPPVCGCFPPADKRARASDGEVSGNMLVLVKHTKFHISTEFKYAICLIHFSFMAVNAPQI